MAAPSAGMRRCDAFAPLVRRRTRNIPAEKKKMPTPAVTPRNESRSSICAEPVITQSPAATTVPRSAMTTSGAEAFRNARTSTTMLIRKRSTRRRPSFDRARHKAK